MARYTKDENGNLILTAGGTRTWIVTQAAHDRAVSAGTAPNNCLVAITDDYLYNEPLGIILAYGGTTAPTGWLLCQGQAVSRTDYADLFAVIGTAFGSGDGATTFNVPDLRETVPVGSGTRGSGVDAHDIYSVGDFKDDQLQSHIHDVQDSSVYNKIGFGQSSGENAGVADRTVATGTSRKWQARDIVAGRTGTTTHGKQLGVNYIIKAQHA